MCSVIRGASVSRGILAGRSGNCFGAACERKFFQCTQVPAHSKNPRRTRVGCAEAHPYNSLPGALLEVEAEAEDAGGSGVEDEQIVGGGDYDFANGGGTCAGNPC